MPHLVTATLQSDGKTLKGRIQGGLQLEKYSKVALDSATVSFLPTEDTDNYRINTQNNELSVQIGDTSVTSYTATLRVGNYTEQGIINEIHRALNSNVPLSNNLRGLSWDIHRPTNLTKSNAQNYFTLELYQYLRGNLFGASDINIIEGTSTGVSSIQASGNQILAFGEVLLPYGALEITFNLSGGGVGGLDPTFYLGLVNEHGMSDENDMLIGIGTENGDIRYIYDGIVSNDPGGAVHGTSEYKIRIYSNTYVLSYNGVTVKTGTLPDSFYDDSWTIFLYGMDLDNSFEIINGRGYAYNTTATTAQLTFDSRILATYLGFKDLSIRGKGEPALFTASKAMRGAQLLNTIYLLAENLPIRNYNATDQINSGDGSSILSTFLIEDQFDRVVSYREQYPMARAYSLHNTERIAPNYFSFIFKDDLTSDALTMEANSNVTILFYERDDFINLV
jgi:hypothetical protein